MPAALLVSSSFLPGRGGIETYLAELCGSLAPQLAVLAPERRDGDLLPRDLPYETHGYRGRLFVPGPRAARAIERAAGASGTDRVLFGTPWPQILTAPRLRRAGLRYASIVHGAELLVPAALPRVRRRLLRALSGADLVLPVSLFTAQRLRDLLEEAGLRVPPLAVLRARVDLDRFRPDAGGPEARARLGIPAAAPVILCLGRMVARKGLDRLIAALPDIEAHAPGTTLVLAGTGPEEKALRRAAARIPQRGVRAGAVRGRRRLRPAGRRPLARSGHGRARSRPPRGRGLRGPLRHGALGGHARGRRGRRHRARARRPRPRPAGPGDHEAPRRPRPRAPDGQGRPQACTRRVRGTNPGGPHPVARVGKRTSDPEEDQCA